MMNHILSIAIIILSVMASSLTRADGATLQDVREMIATGDLEAAHATLDSLAAKLPKNAEVDLLRGRAFTAQSRDKEAVEALESARRKGSNDALLDLGEIALKDYRVDEADNLLSTYRSYIAKNKRKKLTDESGDLGERISRTRSMLDRVEAIEVIDSVNVDADTFFSYFRLSPESGRILPPEALPAMFDPVDPSTVFITEDGRTMMWADLDDDNNLTLRQSDALVGGEWTEAQPVGDHLTPGADATFPFLMPDGVTLYFASNTEGGLGGLDLYITRNNGTRFLDPQNLGMPYNSPYNDYMLAIDEQTGLGWWATDRNQLPGMVTIYTFIPSDVRHNVSIDDPMLVDRARLNSIALTQREGTDYTPQRQAPASLSKRTVQAERAVTTPVAMADGTTVTGEWQLTSERARDAYRRYIAAVERFNSDRRQLDLLRERYASGDHSVAPSITDLERRQVTDRTALQRLAAEVSRAEQSR